MNEFNTGYVIECIKISMKGLSEIAEADEIDCLQRLRIGAILVDGMLTVLEMWMSQGHELPPEEMSIYEQVATDVKRIAILSQL